MLQKEGVNVYEDTARKMRKFKGIEFPRTHIMLWGYDVWDSWNSCRIG